MATKAFSIRGDVELKSAGFEAGARNVRRSMKQLTSDVQTDVAGIRRSMDLATASVVGFGKGLLAGAAGAAGIAGVTTVVSRMVQEAREAQDSQVRLQAVLKATGYTSALSARQLGQFADQMENTTLQTAEAVQDASSVLATFRTVSGDTFTDAIKLSADLSAVFKQDLSASATQLGKALESPVEGIAALRRVGVSFTDAQKDVIQALVDTGQQAEAQRTILKALADQVGGAAEAQRTGTLTGAFFGAANAIGNMLQRWDQITGTAPAVIAALKAVENAAAGVFATPDLQQQVVAQRQQIETLRQQMQREQEGLFRGPENLVALDIQAAEAQLEVLERRYRAEQDLENAAQRRAKAAAAQTQAETNAANVAAAAVVAAEKAKTSAASSGISKIVSAETERAKIVADIRDRELAAWEGYYSRQAEAAEDAATRERQARERLEQERLQNIQDSYLGELRKVGDLLGGPGGTGRDAWGEATDRLQGSVADAVQNGMRSGFDAKSIVDGFGVTLTGVVSESISAALFENVSLKGTLGTKLSGLGIPGFGDATVGQAGLTALGAGFAGYGIGRATGDRGMGFLGGAATGALAGSTLGWPGALAGGAIGGLAGLIGGGATGGERNNNYIGSLDLATGRQLDVMNTRPDAANVSAVQSVLAEVTALREGLKGLGLTVGGGQLDVQSGNKSGLTLNGEKFGSQMALTEAALRQLLAGSGGLSANQNIALANTRATTAQGILGDLGVARQLDDLAAGGGALGQQLRDTARQFDALRVRAEELGLSTKVLDEARADETKAIRENVLIQIGAISPVRAAFIQLDRTFTDVAANAEALGISEERLARLRGKAIEDLKRQQQEQIATRGQGLLGGIQSAFGFLDQLRDTRAGLLTSDLAPGTKLDQYRAIREQFAQTQKLAQAGDLDAINSLSGQGQALLGLSREVFGSSANYGRDFNVVTAALDKVITKNETQEQRLIDALEELGAKQSDTTRDLVAIFTAEIREYRDQVREMERTLNKLGHNLAYRSRAA